MSDDHFPDYITQGDRPVTATDDIFNLFNRGVELSLNAQEYREEGRTEVATECDRDAVAAFDGVLDLDPTHVGAISGKAFTLASLGETHKAVELFRKALEIEPGLAENHRQLGLCYLELGNLDSARDETLLAVSLERHPEFGRMAAIELYNAGGMVMTEATGHRGQGRVEEERRCYEKAKVIFSLSAEVDGKFKEAKQALNIVNSCLGADASTAGVDQGRSTGPFGFISRLFRKG